VSGYAFMERAVLPDFDHPVVMTLRCAVRPGKKEKYEFDESGLKALADSIREHRKDPSLAGGLLGLFALAEAFYREEDSPRAAELIVVLIGALYPELVALRGGASLFPDQLEKSLEAGGFVPRLPRYAPGPQQDRKPGIESVFSAMIKSKGLRNKSSAD
jgi:hypothetical protein